MLDGSLHARVVSASAWLMLCVVAREAWAQPAATTGDAQASEDRRTALYGEGVDAATAGRWADAKERFAAALAIRTLFSLPKSGLATPKNSPSVTLGVSGLGLALRGAF